MGGWRGETTVRESNYRGGAANRKGYLGRKGRGGAFGCPSGEKKVCFWAEGKVLKTEMEVPSGREHGKRSLGGEREKNVGEDKGERIPFIKTMGKNRGRARGSLTAFTVLKKRETGKERGEILYRSLSIAWRKKRVGERGGLEV